ncbi:urokinase-type plasminogen activator-like [Oppia nitens]|uniref:urokinase-type plasminogen activator-like n=1 Tax=Oppia nitens TaxID=1686743 RepID=UPI0023DA4813|nr:urokinase-type plasminogen activator-like [Oppia nitens]
MLQILFIPLFIVVVGGNHAVVGNYSQLNTPLCGLRRVRHSIDSDCLVWHHMETPSLTHARNGTLGDAPWTVLIMLITINHLSPTPTPTIWFTCTGTILTPKWILTVAHCFEDKLDAEIYYVYYGYNYTHNKQLLNQLDNNYSRGKHYYMHPNYTNAGNSGFVNDIGLLELQTEIPVQTDGDYYVTNSICLPARDAILSTDSEYLLMAGYGYPYIILGYIPVQFSIRQIDITNNDNNNTDITDNNKIDNKLVIKHKSIHAGIVCKGDSGSGLWQYMDEKAVLIGVHSNSLRFDLRVNCTAHPNIGYAVRVSKYIDWILNYIYTK